MLVTTETAEPKKTTYKIRFNGGLYYRVEIVGHTATVKTSTGEILQHIVFSDVFIGELGYTLLLHINGLQYAWIAHEGPKFFVADAPIVEYAGPIGNNEVPYPYARDSVNRIYLLMESVIIGATDEDPYTVYYNNYSIAKPYIGTSWNSITGLSIDGEPYNFTYEPFPEADYDRLTTDIGPVHIMKNGETRPLSKSEYVQIVRDFGYERGYRPLILSD